MTTHRDLARFARTRRRLGTFLGGNPLLPFVALAGFAASFQTIAALAEAHGLPGWKYQYPLGIDVGILALIIESRRAIADGRSDLVPRTLAWALSLFTIYVNAHGSPSHDVTGRALHIVMPSLWVAFLELTRWRQIRAERADKIPLSRWLVAPLRTCGMRRRMIEHNITSYPVACAREEARLAAVSLMTVVWGPDWKRTAPALLRHQLKYGTLPEALSSTCAIAGGGYAPPVAEQAEQWVTSARQSAVRVRAQARQDDRAISAPSTAPSGAPSSAPSRRATKPRQPAAGDRANRNAAARQLLIDNPAMLRADVAAQAGVSPRTVDRIKSELTGRPHLVRTAAEA